jgi:hypothetical protein
LRRFSSCGTKARWSLADSSCNTSSLAITSCTLTLLMNRVLQLCNALVVCHNIQSRLKNISAAATGQCQACCSTSFGQNNLKWKRRRPVNDPFVRNRSGAWSEQLEAQSILYSVGCAHSLLHVYKRPERCSSFKADTLRKRLNCPINRLSIMSLFLSYIILKSPAKSEGPVRTCCKLKRAILS